MLVDPPSSAHLASRLVAAAEYGRPDAYYRLARMVARVLVSVNLRQHEKWRTLARQLALSPGVEDRLIFQAMGWLQRGQGIAVTAA